MGQVTCKITDPLKSSYEKLINFSAGSRKRKRDFRQSTDSHEVTTECHCDSPKKKRLLTTTKYIYQALFKEEKNSDVAVMALNKVWHLHKVYLGQSPYFHSMFNGSWCEAAQDFVQLEELDENITRESLDAVFGSMYSDEIEVEPQSVVAVLATATLFHLQGIIDKCTEVMNENVNENNVVQYYGAAERYGCMQVKETAFHWLEINLSSINVGNTTLVRNLSIELMTQLLKSPNLYVMQTEFSLYTLLRTWMFLRLFPDFDPKDPKNNFNSNSNCIERENLNDKPSAIQTFYRSRKNDCSFLATQEGQPYLPAFRALRTQFLINHFVDMNFIMMDNIVPHDWLKSHIAQNWRYLLRVDNMNEEGPKDISEEVFLESSSRCGRILLLNTYQKWRWTGFNYGLDLIIVYDTRTINIRRHHRHEHERLLSSQPKRSFLIKASATSINEQRQPICTETTEILSVTLEKNQDRELIRMNSKLKPPLLISVSMLTTEPADTSIKNMPLTTTSLDNTVPISEITGDLERSNNITIDLTQDSSFSTYSKRDKSSVKTSKLTN